MRVFELIALLGLTGMLGIAATAEESNWWPVVVRQPAAVALGPQPRSSWQGGGPLFFGRTSAAGIESGGFRPFYVYRRNPEHHTAESDFLYPLLTHREYATDERWSLFDLIIFEGPKNPDAPGVRGFDIWPVYFSRDTGKAATSYHAVFPIHGTMLNRLGYDRLSWTLFPLYARLERQGLVTTAAPWPFVKIYGGDGNRGFALWPLFGRWGKPGVYQNEFYLWPLIYRNESRMTAAQPTVSLGVLPFYARDQSAGALSETFVWPFFGYTHRWAPYHYRETRWFWPLWVQGRGDERLVDRWAPFYTHSIYKGDDKRWVLWPIFRQEKWTDAGLAQTKTQFLYFIYWSLRERSAAQPARFSAQKTHLWPLFSYWNNGAGRRQLQILSPLEVFFQDNEPVRLAYSPLFAVYRYEQTAPGDVRWSLLWDAITWRRSPSRREFHLGPLLSVTRGPRGKRIALIGGLFGLRKPPGGGGWRPFLFDFSGKTRKKVSPVAPP